MCTTFVFDVIYLIVSLYNLIFNNGCLTTGSQKSLKIDQSAPISSNEPAPARLVLSMPVLLPKRHNFLEGGLDVLQGQGECPPGWSLKHLSGPVVSRY